MHDSDIPTLRALWTIIATDDSTFSYLKRQGIFSIPSRCEVCGGNVSIYGTKARCTRRACRKAVSCLRNSFFANSHLSIADALLLGYVWLTGASYSVALAQTGHSPNTIVDYYSFFRELVADSLDSEDWTIGGDGVVVEVDESKFGKRKYNRGKRIEGAWVIGGIERTEAKRFFAVVVKSRDSETIIDVLSKHILPGSIVHTDCWRGYCDIEENLGVERRTVNHSKGYVELKETEFGDWIVVDKVDTNTIEAKWGALKQKILLRGNVSERLPNYLLEQIWRMRNRSRLWAAFLSALGEIFYE
jgi:transposase-like protein